MGMGTHWRLQKQVRDNGKTYFTLLRGAGEERRSIGLGYVTPEQAERATRFMLSEDARTAGTAEYDAILRQIGENPALRLKLVEAICDDRDLSLRSVFGAPPKKHALMPLEE